MIYHYVVWLDISVDNIDNLVAVVKSFKHVDQVAFYLLDGQTFRYYII